MANKTATVTVNLSYQGPSNVVVESPIVIGAPFKAFNVAVVDVPDTTAATTSFPCPVGSIGTEVTMILIVNDTGQDMDVIINGAAANSHTLAANGSMLIANPAAAGLGTKLTSVAVETTAIQSGDGEVKVWAFGDPV